MIQKTKTLFPSVLSAVFLFSATSAFAVKEKVEPFLPNVHSIPEFLKQLLDALIKIGIPLSAGFIIYAGFLFVSAQGDTSKLKQAKSAIVWSVVGLTVVLMSWMLATGIQNTMNSIAK